MKILQILAAMAVLTATGGSPAVGQVASSPDSIKAARELIGTMSGTVVTDMVSKMTVQVWPSMEAALRVQNSSIDAAALTELRGEFEKLLAGSVGEAMKDAPEIYAKYLSAKDMREMLAFYKTPAGVNALKAMPQVTADISAAMAPRAQGLQERVNLAFLTILQKRGLYAR